MSSNTAAVTIVEEDIKQLQYYKELIGLRYQANRSLRYRCELIHLNRELKITRKEMFNMQKTEADREFYLWYNQNFFTKDSNKCSSDQQFQQSQQEGKNFGMPKYSSKFAHGSSNGAAMVQQ